MGATYEDARKHPTRTKRGETNDCGVLAVCIATGADYGDVLETMYKLGREPRTGTPMYVIWAALREFGFVAVDETGKWVGEKIYSYGDGWRGRASTRRTGRVKTVVTAERYLPKRNTYLILTGGRTTLHILCVKRGKVQDWTAGRRNRVLNVWRIEKKD